MTVKLLKTKDENPENIQRKATHYIQEKKNTSELPNDFLSRESDTRKAEE